MSDNLVPVGSIDIENTVVLHDDTIMVRGWCLIDEKEPPARGQVFVNGEEIGEVQFTEPRPDVDTAFPQYKWGVQSGFTTLLKIEKKFQGQCRLGIRVSNPSGESHYLEKRIIFINPDGSSLNSRNLFKFRRLDPTLPSAMDHFPLQAYVEVTTACNLSCIMCRDDIKTKDVPTNLFFDYDLFLKLTPLLPFLRFISLGGWGEPTLHKRFIDFLALTRENNPEGLIRFTSNFNRISEELMDAFIDYQVSSINISIDGASAGVYEKIRKKGSFETMLDNIQKLNRKKQENNSEKPELSFEFVVQKANIHELPEYIELIHGLGGREIVLEHVCAMPHLEIDYRENLNYYHEALEKTGKLGIHMWGAACEHFKWAEAPKEEKPADTPPLSTDPHTPPPEPPLETPSPMPLECYEPYQTVYINPDGRITPCCVNPRTMGNLNDQSFEDIWFGDQYTNLRQQMVDRKYDASCSACVAVAKNIPKIHM